MAEQPSKWQIKTRTENQGEAILPDVAKTILAKRGVDEFAFHLGHALSNLAVTLAPEVFIIGGGVSQAGEFLLEYVQKYYRASDSKLVLATKKRYKRIKYETFRN